MPSGRIAQTTVNLSESNRTPNLSKEAIFPRDSDCHNLKITAEIQHEWYVFSMLFSRTKFSLDCLFVISYRTNVSADGQVNACKTLQDEIITFLDRPIGDPNGPIPTHIGRWGNSSVLRREDWIQISVINESESSPPTLSAGPK